MEHGTILWVEDSRELNQKDQENARSVGFNVFQKRNLELWQNYLDHLDDFVAVIFVVTRANCGKVFRNLKAINDYKMVSGHLRPIIVVIPPPSFSARAKADFSLLGCCVLPNLRPDQVFSFLEVLVVAHTAIDRHGAPIWQPNLTGHPIVVGPTGIPAELRLEGHQRKIWATLKKQCGQIVFPEDLAKEAGCDSNQIRVHIDRIRAKFAACAQKVELAMDPEEFIETLDGGYRLNAQIQE
jgi:hypothetical protein